MSDMRKGFRRESDRHLVAALERLVDSQREALRRAVIGYLILVLGIAGALYAVQRHDVSATQRKALNAACVRVNVLRKQVNTLAQNIYGLLYLSAQREHALANAPTFSPSVREAHRKSEVVIGKYAANMRRSPITNCQQALAHPGSYNPAAPVRFTPKDAHP